MAPKTPSQLLWLLKQYLHGQRVEDLVLRNHPVMDIIRKDETFQGSDEPFPVYTSPGVGVSGDFATAQALAGNGEGHQFKLVNGKLYGFVVLDDESLERTRSRQGSYLDLKRQEAEGTIGYMGEVLAGQLMGEGGGAIAQLSSNPANTSSQTFELKNKAQINGIEVGQQLVASVASGASSSDALRTANYVTVTAVNRNDGTFVGTQSADVSSWAADDYLFLRETFGGASAANNAKPIKGFRAWFPRVVTSTAFFGVDRTVDDRLTGTRFLAPEASGSGLTRIQAAATKTHERFRGTPRLCVVTPQQFLDISIELQNTGPNRSFDKKVDTGRAGYRGLELVTPYGEITIISDASTVQGDGWLLHEDYMVLKSMKKLVHVMDADGQEMRAAASTPTYEMRLVSYPQLGISRPTEFCRIDMPTAA